MFKDKEDTEKNSTENGEDATLYGEFVCSMHHWLYPQEQRRNAKHLENITRKQEKKQGN